MILTSSVFNAMDNSGARRLKCLKVYSKPGRSCAGIGDLMKVLVVTLRNRGTIRIKKGEMHLALVTRIASTIHRGSQGSFLKFDSSAAILLSKKKVLIGNRIFGPCPRELYKGSFGRLLTMAQHII